MSLSLLLPTGGLWDQINIGSKSALYNHVSWAWNKLNYILVYITTEHAQRLICWYGKIYAWLLIGCLGMIVIMTWHSSAIALWIGILFYGFGNGPCVGYCCKFFWSNYFQQCWLLSMSIKMLLLGSPRRKWSCTVFYLNILHFKYILKVVYYIS